MGENPERPGLRPSRRVVVIEAMVEIGERRWPVELLDLSLGGARLLCPEGLRPQAGQALVLGLRAEPARWLRFPAAVIRGDGDELACRFDALLETRSDDLRQLIRERGSLDTEW